jgi:hypothetical protein
MNGFEKVVIEKVKVINEGYGSSLNAVSQGVDELILIKNGTPFELDILKADSQYKKALIYVEEVRCNKQCIYLKPLHDIPHTLGPMSGGNKAKMCDVFLV